MTLSTLNTLQNSLWCEKSVFEWIEWEKKSLSFMYFANNFFIIVEQKQEKEASHHDNTMHVCLLVFVRMHRHWTRFHRCFVYAQWACLKILVGNRNGAVYHSVQCRHQRSSRHYFIESKWWRWSLLSFLIWKSSENSCLFSFFRFWPLSLFLCCVVCAHCYAIYF